MTTTKIAITVPRDVLARARRAARRGPARSMSAWVAKAMEEKAKRDDLGELLDEMLAESGGPLTATERRAAERIVLARKRPKR